MKLLEFLRSVLMRSSRVFVWSATSFGLVVLLSFFAAIGYDFYRSTRMMNEQAAMNVATLMEQDIARNIELYDLSLQSVLDGVNDPDVLYQEPGLRQKILFDRSATAPGLGSIVALDAKGDVILDSLSFPPRVDNLSDREFFLVHRDRDLANDTKLYVSQPFMSRVQNVWAISVSRRINKPDGSFAGAVSGTIKLDYFQHLFDKVAMGKSDTIVLLRDDGTLMARNSAVAAAVGANWRSAPIFTYLDRAQGSFVSNKSDDGVGRLYAFHRIGNLPLVVVVGISTNQILAPWRTKMLVLAAIFAIMASSVLALVWMLEGELLRRAAAEKAAAELARTDALTKLANRRWFDEEMSRKWAWAVRNGRPMSLLMIDVDHFKLFNDTYGHQAGDLALTAIAAVIDAAIRRPDDLAARYGGEEFAVLLPDTDRQGATGIAEAISEQVRALQIDHITGPKAVTISIGVAAAQPRSSMAKAALLIRDADAALYRAKHEGRNTVCISNVMPADFEPRFGRVG